MVNVFDILFSVFIVFSCWLGYWGGLFVAVFLAILVAGMFGLIEAGKAAGGAVYLVFFAGTALVTASLFGFYILLVSVVLKHRVVRMVHRLGGAALGLLLSMILIGSTVLPVAHHTSKRVEEIVFASYTVSYILPWSQDLFPGLQSVIVGQVNDTLTYLTTRKEKKKDKKKNKNTAEKTAEAPEIAAEVAAHLARQAR